MNKLLSAVCLVLSAFLQSFAQADTQPYGKIDLSDLELKECSFEKDANAMVLFDKGDVYFDQQFAIILKHHKRIKIFNEKAKNEANIRLEYYSGSTLESISDIDAHTINLKDGKAVITQLEKKQVFKEKIDKYRTALVFTFPDVQAGSIIEFKYEKRTRSIFNFPSWFFQSNLPTRYTELATAIPDMFYYKAQYKTQQVVYKNKTSEVARSLGSNPYLIKNKLIGLKNIPSLVDEPFMTSRFDNLQCALFQLTSIRPIGGFVESGVDTWNKVGGRLIEDEDFGMQFRKKLDGEEVLITKAKQLVSDDEKIAFLFNEVKSNMKWNGIDNWYTNDGTPKAWEKKIGNSTEINLILYRLLKQSGVKQVYPMIVSTREHGRVNIAYPWLHQFNRTVLNFKPDSTKHFVLDASDKYNVYSTIPDNLLNSFGVSVDKENKKFHMIFIEDPVTSLKVNYLSAKVNPNGTMSGSVSLNNFRHHKTNTNRDFNLKGEEKYKNWLTGKDNSLKIKSYKTQGADIDSLPLVEHIEFDLELAGSEGEYIYFTPNLFTGLNKNPFVSENRTTIIDFGCKNKQLLTSVFTLPAGFKADVLPKNISLTMPDKSVLFQRVVSIEEGQLSLRYLLDFKKSVYTIEDYPYLREFYKQIIELINEQVVLKKS